MAFSFTKGKRKQGHFSIGKQIFPSTKSPQSYESARRSRFAVSSSVMKQKNPKPFNAF